MANLKEIAELSYKQIYPVEANAAASKEEFIRTAYTSWAYQQLLMAWKQRSDDGYMEIPSYLLTTVSKDIVDNVMDISDLKYFKSLPNEMWLQNLGGFGCKCRYIKSTINLSQLLCDDDSLDDAAKTYFILGKSIQFPKGTHATPLEITFANMGEDVNGNIEVDEAIGDLIRTRLNELYLGKILPADMTNNNNPNE